MSIDYWYQAIPHDSVVLKKAMANANYAGNMDNRKSLMGEETPGPDDKIYEEFMADVWEMNGNHPGLWERNCIIYTNWDILHFLLSEERWLGKQEETDLGTIAVYGATAATSWFEWPQYTSPPQVESVFLYLDTITESEILKRADPKELEKCYKGYGYTAENIGKIWKYFDLLRNFYRAACQHNEAVIVNQL